MRRTSLGMMALALLLGSVIWATACGSGTTTDSSNPSAAASSGSTAATGTPIKIGQVMSLTGMVAAPAKSATESIKQEVAYINANGGVNGRPIELILEDDKSDANAAVAAMTKLIEQDKVDVVLGPFAPFAAGAARAVAEKAGVVDVIDAPPTMADVSNTSYKWSFQASAGPDASAAALLEALKAEGYKNVLGIADNLQFDQEILELLKQGAAADGITFTAMSDTWGLAETDLSPIVAKIAGQARSVEPDALVVLANSIHAPTIQKGLRALGVNQQIFGSEAAASPALFLQGPRTADGMIVIGPGIVNATALPKDYPGQAEMLAFSQRFEAATKQPADFYAGIVADALHLAVNAMETAGGTDPAKVRAALESTKDYQGLQGIFTYSPTDHVGIHGGRAEWRVENGTFQFVRDLTGGQ